MCEPRRVPGPSNTASPLPFVRSPVVPSCQCICLQRGSPAGRQQHPLWPRRAGRGCLAGYPPDHWTRRTPVSWLVFALPCIVIKSSTKLLPCPISHHTHVSLCRTNITEQPREYASSRGTLVASFLGDPSGDLTSEAEALTRQTTPYAGFNLLLLEPSSSAPSTSTLAYDAQLVTNGGGGGPIRSRTLTDAERACGGLSNGIDGHGGDLWPKVAQGRAELGQVLDEELEQLSGGPADDERLAGRLIELLTCVSTSGPVPRALCVCAVGGVGFALP